MKMMLKYLVLLCLPVAALSTVTRDAYCGVILDHSPETTQAEINPDITREYKYYVNQYKYQYFADRVLFQTNTTVTGMDIYSRPNGVELGKLATIEIYQDSANFPGAVITTFNETISEIDTEGSINDGYLMYRAHVDFTTPITLTGGVQYWIGMSGAQGDVGLLTLFGPNAPDDDQTVTFRPYESTFRNPIGDMAFRLEGFSTAVPEPSTLALGSLGLIGLGIAACRRRFLA